MKSLLLLVPVIGATFLGSGSAALILNPSQAITEEVRIYPILVSGDDGSDTAPFLGTPTQQAAIEGMVDQIYAQAGIDITFLPPGSYHSTFALTGTSGNNNPRPSGDLSAIVSAAMTAGGILHPDPNVINLFFVRIVPGFSQNSANTANGLGFVGSNGIAQWVGANLAGFTGGQEVAASVIAHEIGHNLGLSHVVAAENLMQAGGSPSLGERLDGNQIQTALNSLLSRPIPEPSTVLLLLMMSLPALLRRRRQG